MALVDMPQPGILGASSAVAGWDATRKLLEAARRAGPLLPEDMREEFAGLFSPEALATTAAALGVLIAAQAVGVGEVADAALLLIGLKVLGLQALEVGKDLADYATVAARARSDADLQQAAGHLARAVAVLGVTAVFALLMKKAGKAFKRLRRGRVPQRPEVWWEADQFGEDFPGTSIPKGFRLKVGNRTFVIKPNATKHMADHIRGRTGVGAYAGQVEFPLSSLAAALEEAEAGGGLRPLLRREVLRLGTPEQPFRIGDWELALEWVGGRLEVFHAVFKP
jgi:hypothetical protein